MLFRLIRSGAEPKEIAFIIILYFLALSLAFAGHEFAHAFAAHLMGDDTAKNRGRLTLNPVAHIDPLGMISLIFLGLGWGKPVPVNPNNFSKFNVRLSNVIVDLAGVTANFIMAFICSIGSVFVIAFGSPDNMWMSLIAQFFELSYLLNISLMGFNLLPIPPLDGFNFWVNVLPVKFKYTKFFRVLVQYGPRVLLILVFAGMLFNIPVLSIIIDIISWPFSALISLVSGMLLAVLV